MLKVARELARFVARFDRGEFWLAHEELEPLWLKDREEFLQALLQVAASMVHAERRNWRGAHRKLTEALARLDRVPAWHRGCDIDTLKERLRILHGFVDRAAATGSDDVDDLPRVVLAPLFPAGDRELSVEDADVPYRVRRYREGFRIGRDPGRRD